MYYNTYFVKQSFKSYHVDLFNLNIVFITFGKHLSYLYIKLLWRFDIF